MSQKVAILTDFLSYDPAYSLCQVVAHQCLMVNARLIVRKGFNHNHRFQYRAEIVEVDPGEIGPNRVNLTGKTEDEIQSLTEQLREALDGCSVVLTHDLIYQPNQFKYHVAAKRLGGDIRWFHWIHSATPFKLQAGAYQEEINAKFPNSKLVAFHPEEVERKRVQFGYERDEVVIIPHPLDLTEDYDPFARAVISQNELWDKDIIAIYPARLDRGKQPHIILEIFRELKQLNYKVKVIIVDFHSTEGDKAAYRNLMKDEFGDLVFFTSDLGGEAEYSIPHRAVMDLYEYGDILLQPSRSETYSLIVLEAAWKRCGLILNSDLSAMRQYERWAGLYKFSSDIDLNAVAQGIAHQMENNPVLSLHQEIRQTRSLEAVGRTLLNCLNI